MPDPKTLNFDLRARTKALFKVAQRKEKSRLQVILQTGNMERVDQLNAGQQADFLRQGDSSVRSVRRLAKRVTVMGDEIENEVEKSLQIIRDSNVAVSEETDLPSSFYGLYDDPEVIDTVKQEFDDLSQLSTDSILQIIGQVGITFYLTDRQLA